jgi:CelD/BcsL family acetyltransferase involved in cellulose biosynthesis
MLQRDAHFTELQSGASQFELPPWDPNSDLDGVLIRSHPIELPPPRLRLRGGLLWYCPAKYRRYWIDLRGSFADYTQKFSGKTRSTLGRKVRRFRESSGTEPVIREFKRPEEMEEFFSVARTISEKTYQERLLDAGLPSTDAFRDGLIDLARRGRVRGFILSMGARPVAYLYCPIYKDTGILLYSHLGYDPEFEHLSPGTVLQYLALERLFEEGETKLFDFLEGETPQKQLFATGNTLCADLYFFRLTPRNACLVLLHNATDSVSTAVVRALDFLGIKRRLKKLIRRGYKKAGPR